MKIVWNWSATKSSFKDLLVYHFQMNWTENKYSSPYLSLQLLIEYVVRNLCVE